MARGRMIDRTYTSSRKLNSLSRDHRYMYACILPYLDKAGRIVAEPIVLKANVFRWTDVTLDELPAGIVALEAAGLIRLYADGDNGAILQFEKFKDKNTPNSKEKESDLPGPDDPSVKPVWCEEIQGARASHVGTHVQCTGQPTGYPTGTAGKA